MKLFGIQLAGLLLIFQACHNSAPPPAPVKEEEKKNYFPVADFVRSEIAYVDSFPLRIVRYHIESGKTDSAFIQAPAFEKLAQEFLPPELEDSLFQKGFTESSFIDQTNRAATLTYAAKDSTLNTTRVDVLATPKSNGSNEVSSLYIQKTLLQGDTTVIKKMYWKSRTEFLILTIKVPRDQKEISSKLKVVWGDSE